jgi:predicted GNAT family N-acyltransferase
MIVCRIEFATPEFDEALALRYEILRRPLGLHYSPEQLTEEWDNLHIAAFDAQAMVIGYLNLTPIDQELIKMRQVAVAASQQGKGVGRAMVAFSEELAKELGYKKISLHARQSAVPFYLNIGYMEEGAPFEEVGLPHFKMTKVITS